MRSKNEDLYPVLLSERHSENNEADGKISDQIYDRIPDTFKESSESENEENGTSSEQEEDSQDPSFLAPKAPERPKGPKVEIHRIDSEHEDPSGPNTSGSGSRSVFHPFLFIVTLCLLVFFFFSGFSRETVMEVSWNGFNILMDTGKIDSVLMRGNRIEAKLKEAPSLSKLPEILPEGDLFYTNLLLKAKPKLNPDQLKSILTKPLEETWYLAPVKRKNPRKPFVYKLQYIENNQAKGMFFLVSTFVTCEIPMTAFADQTLDQKIRGKVQSFTSSTPSDQSGLIIGLVSLGFTILLFWMIFRMRRMSDPGNYLNNFGQSPARRYEPNTMEPVTFADVAGLDNVKSELVEIVDFLKNPERYERMGARVPKGTLLFGPPGTGKTLLGRAVAGEAGVPFFSINGSEFIQMYVGVGASRVRDLFNVAKQNAPAILFIDEIDAVGRQRGTGVGGGHDEREQTLNQILSEMDGFTPTESVMVMAATNRPDVLDQALMRPGRFDRHITVDRPSMKGRVEIFNVYLAKIPYASDVDVAKLARSTVGFTGADIRNLVNEATLWATRCNKETVEMADFEFAHEKVVLGLKREEAISEKDKRKTAYHEAGHTILGWFSSINSHVHKVTIIPRGQALGATYFLPDDEQLNINESQVQAMLVRYLGGRAAERLVFNETSAGAENDLKQATQLARSMVIHWGMSPKLGPIAFRTGESHPFLGREISENREYSEATAQLIDEEILRILREADDTANSTLSEKRELLDKLSDALVEEEELDQERIESILGPSPYPPQPIKI